MIEIEHIPGDQWDELDQRAERLRRLDWVDAKALQVAVQGAGANFDPDHKASIAWADNGTVVIGSSSLSYVRILRLAADDIAQVYVDWVDEGAG